MLSEAAAKPATFQTSGAKFSTTQRLLIKSSGWTLRKVSEEDPALLEKNFRAYINGFSKNVDDIIEHFNYRATIGTMVKNNQSHPVTEPVVRCR
jgi:type I restriction enzyme M protein